MKKDNRYSKYYNDIKFDYNKLSMYDIINKRINDHDDKTAFTYGINKVKYSFFIKKVNEYALSFSSMGVKCGDTVTLILPNSFDTLVCIYAINKIGAISNIMHHLSSKEEIKRSINDNMSHYVITYENKLKELESILTEEYIYKVIYISLNDLLSPIDKIKNIFKKQLNLPSKYISFYRCRMIGKISKNKYTFTKNNTALIINNNSKCINITNENINSYAVNFASMNELFKERNKVFTDNSIINSIPIIHRSLSFGSNIIINSNENIKSIIESIIKYKPNILEISPNTLEQFITNKKVAREDLSHVKLIICGRSVLRDNVYKKAIVFLRNHNSDAKIVTSFGMIETTSNVTYNPDLDNKMGSVGVPIKETSISIIDEKTHKEVKEGEVGIISISGPSVTNTQINSDDLGYLDKDGFLYFKSSLKRVIVSNGIEIYPEELEAIIKKHEYIKDASIVGVPHPYKKEVVKLYIVLKNNLVLNSEIKKSIRDYCEKNIAKYALPYAYAYRKELPKTNVGKIAYQELVNLKEEE